MSGWINPNDRLPETDGKNTHDYDVLCYVQSTNFPEKRGIYIGKVAEVKADDGSGNFLGIKRERCDWTIWGWGYYDYPIVLAWMPLPEPPKDEAEGLNERIENAYVKLDEVMTELDDISDEIIDRAYDETRAPMENTQEYRDAMHTVNAICDAMTEIQEAENFLSNVI